MASKPNAKTEVTRQVIGLAFNETRIRAALIGAQGRILAERRAEMALRTTRAAANEMARLVLDVASAPERGDGYVVALGLAADGQVDPATARVSLPALRAWRRVPLLTLIEEALNEAGHDIRTPARQRRARATVNHSSHPAMMTHTRLAAMAAGEAWTGAAAGKRNVVYIAVGATVEAGVLSDGRALRGANGLAGSVGWMVTSGAYDREHQARGAFNADAGAHSFARRAIDGWSGFADSIIGGTIKTDPGALDAMMLIRAARGGDALASRVVTESCRALGRGVANLISLFDPDVIVIGGELSAAFKPYLNEIRAEARRWAAPEAAKRCRIVAATLGETAAVIGAARLAWPEIS